MNGRPATSSLGCVLCPPDPWYVALSPLSFTGNIGTNQRIYPWLYWADGSSLKNGNPYAIDWYPGTRALGVFVKGTEPTATFAMPAVSASPSRQAWAARSSCQQSQSSSRSRPRRQTGDRMHVVVHQARGEDADVGVSGCPMCL